LQKTSALVRWKYATGHSPENSITQEPVAAIEDYRSQLKQAGIDKVMDEVKAQIESYTPVK
jgi:hypothetical protein